MTIPQQTSQPNQTVMNQQIPQTGATSQPSNQGQTGSMIPPQQMQQPQMQHQQSAASQHQQQHIPAQSLPHGAHAAAIAAAVNIGPPSSNTTSQHQHHTAQSLGHNVLQQNKPSFMTPAQNQSGFHQQIPMGTQAYTQTPQQGNPSTMMSQPSGQPQQQIPSQGHVQDQATQQNYQQYTNVQNVPVQHMQQIPQNQQGTTQGT